MASVSAFGDILVNGKKLLLNGQDNRVVAALATLHAADAAQRVAVAASDGSIVSGGAEPQLPPHDMDIDGGAPRECPKRKASFADPVTKGFLDAAMDLAEQLKAACSSVAAASLGSGLQPPARQERSF